MGKYSEARSGAFYQVSTELAAKRQVDMERARNDLEEHQLICPRAPAGTDEVRSEGSNQESFGLFRRSRLAE